MRGTHTHTDTRARVTNRDQRTIAYGRAFADGDTQTNGRAIAHRDAQTDFVANGNVKRREYAYTVHLCHGLSWLEHALVALRHALCDGRGQFA